MVLMEGFGEEVILLQVFIGHDDDLAGESVAQGVEGGALLAGFGAGAGGVEGVGAVGGGAAGFFWVRGKRRAARGGSWFMRSCAPCPMGFWVGHLQRRRERINFCCIRLRARASAG